MKYLKKIVLLILFFMTTTLLYSCKEDTTTNAKPILTGADNVTISLFESFDPLEGVGAFDTEDGDLTSLIQVSGDLVDSTVVGSYNIIYTVTDQDGNETKYTRTVTVAEIDESLYPLANYPDGIDLTYLPASQKAILFTALEEYITENLYGGIPLYHRGSGILYSSRVNLAQDQYSAIFGYSEAYSSLTEDDSTVLMIGDSYGYVGDYTYRQAFLGYIVSWNPWETDASLNDDINKLFSGSLYQYAPDVTGNNLTLIPDLAKSEPIAIGGSVIDGVVKSTTWEVQVKDDMTWTFNPLTDTSKLAAGYEVLDASDFYNTWKLALDNDWYRAISGGIDFVSMGVVGVADYLNGTEQWKNVGIKLNQETNSLQIEFNHAIPSESVKYMFANSGVYSPLNLELYTALTTNYGTSPETVASSGPYYLDGYVEGSYISLKKNDNYPLKDMYHYTGLLYKFFTSQEDALAEFVRGGLDYATVPFASLDDFANDERLKVVDSGTVFGMSINGFGTVEARDAFIELHPEFEINSDFVPEPILQYLEMKKALYYGIDRITASSVYGVSSLPSSTYFTRQNYVGYEEALSIYGSEYGIEFLNKYQNDVFMYDPVLALDYFKQAVARGVEDGYYQAGSASEYTEINVDLVYSTTTNQDYIDYINNIVSQYETLLVDDTNYVKFTINVIPVDFPDNYYEYIMVANTDLGIYGLSYMCNTLFDFFKDFTDGYFDSNFTNFGIDTSSQVIAVSYTNLEGKVVYERWSFNELVEALTVLHYSEDIE